MNYAQIRPLDVANGPGIRVSFFVSGCTHNCPGCFNQIYQDFKYGKIWTVNETLKIKEYLAQPYISGLTVLGGEPFQNREGVYQILKEIKPLLRLNQDIWIYSGYLWEDLIKYKDALAILSMCDVLVDGPFVEEKKNLNLAYRGSSNQRIIKIQDTLKLFNRGENNIILWNKD